MDVKNIHVNPKMIASVRQSHAAYKDALLAKQQKENEEQLKMKEDKKCKALDSSLQQQKKINDAGDESGTVFAVLPLPVLVRGTVCHCTFENQTFHSIVLKLC